MQPIIKYVVATVMLAGLSVQAMAGSLNVMVFDQSGKPLEDAVISMEPADGSKLQTKSNMRANMAQENRTFVPHVLPVQTGTIISFPNRDDVKHHVYSFSKTKPFEIKLYSGSEANPITFDSAGEVALGCNIHDWMLGYVYVVDTPLFAKSDFRGNAKITNVPPGSYKVNIWQPRIKGSASKYSKTARIGSGDARMDFTLNVSKKRNVSPPGFAREGY